MGRDVGPGAQTRVLTSWQSGVIETPVATAHAHTAVALHSPLSTFALGAKPGRHIGLSVGSMELRHGAGAAAIVTCCSRGPLPRIFIFELVEGILSLIILVVLSRGEGIVERIELPVIRGLGHQGGRAPRHQLAMVFANTPCETKSENGFTANCQIDLSCHGAAVQSENLAQSAILDRGGNQQTAHTASLSHWSLFFGTLLVSTNWTQGDWHHRSSAHINASSTFVRPSLCIKWVGIHLTFFGS